MNKRRLIFFGIFGVFHLIAFVFTVVMETNVSILLNLVSYIGAFKYITFFGLVLMVTDFVWAWQENRKAKKNEDAARLENNTLKAKVYDMQEAGKPKVEMPSPKPAAK
jgi:hypothetical protein